MTQMQRQRTMPAHRVTGDALTVQVGGELRADEGRQLMRDIGLHREMRRPGWLGRIDVKARALPQIIAVIIGDSLATRRGIGRHHHQAELAGDALQAGLLHHIRPVAGQAREIPDHRHRPVLGLRRRIDGKAHRAATGLAVMIMDGQCAAERGPAGNGCQGQRDGSGLMVSSGMVSRPRRSRARVSMRLSADSIGR